MLQVEGVGKTYEAREVVKHISFSMQRGERFAVIGASGSGKSTLLKMIAGQVQPSYGSIYFNEKPVLGPNYNLLARQAGIGYLSQHFQLPNNYYVEEIIAYENRLNKRETDWLINTCGIASLLKRKTNSGLSGGEKQRVALAALLTQRLQLLILDEPFTNLDLINARIIQKLLAEVENNWGVTSLLSSHYPVEVLDWAERILVLEKGACIQLGISEVVYNNPQNEYVAALLGDYETVPAEPFFPEYTSEQRLFVRPEQLSVSIIPGSGVAAQVLELFTRGIFKKLVLDVQGQRVVLAAPDIGLFIGQTVYVRLKNYTPWVLPK